MSTRCQIGVYEKRPTKKGLPNFEALLYRHSDGYPDTESGVLHDIIPFLQDFQKNRGLDDSEYVSARLMQHLTNIADQQLDDWYKERPEYQTTAQTYKYTGFGICNSFHGDIEYYYAISPTHLDVYDVSFADVELPERVEKIKSIKL